MANQSQQHIHCSINNCHYWSQGNWCQAAEIMVTSDTMANSLPDKIDAPYSNQITQTPVANCVESCCKTFVPKNSYFQNVDGVLKK